MGYWANSIEGNINIPITERYEVMNTVREAYAKANKTNSWISTDTAKTIEQELNEWGFEYEIDGVNENDQFICVYAFDGKWRDGLDEFISAILIHATDDSAMAFRGEDGEMWRFAKNVNGAQTATVVWE